VLPEGIVSDRTPGGKGRQNLIGGSDWPHIISLSNPVLYKYGCIRRLWYEKRGVEPDFGKRMSRGAIRGKILEKIVAEIFQKDSGCRFIRERKRAKELWPGQKRPKWWDLRCDRMFVLPEDELVKWVLECKTMGQQVFYDYIENGLSNPYRIQPQHYMAAAEGVEHSSLATVWPDGIDYWREDIDKDLETIRMMFDAGEWFMKSVVQSPKPPERLPLTEQRCAGCPYRIKCLGTGYFEQHVLKEMNLDQDEQLYRLLSKFEGLREKETAVKAEREEIKQEIQDHLEEHYNGDPEKIHCREIDVSWKKGYMSRLDKNALTSSDPKIAIAVQAHTKVIPQRRFTTKITNKSRDAWERRQR